MKNVYLIVLLACISAFAQNENNHWQLGPLDFNFSTNPNTVSTVSGISDFDEYDGKNNYATISDDNGNLKFYFDGRTFFDKNHNVMTNGYTSIPPSYSISFQESIIVPQPGNDNIYYVFLNTLYQLLNDTAGKSYYYYVKIDFSNNPLGEVVPDMNGIPAGNSGSQVRELKDGNGNVIFNLWEYRPLTVTKNSTDNGYWIIAQEGNKLHSYLIDGTGVNPIPVTTTFPVNTINHGGADNIRLNAMFRIVPDYNNLTTMKLYGLEGLWNNFYSLNFNNANGQFSNFQQLTLDQTGTYNFEISNDYKKIYFVQGSNENYYTSTISGKIYVKDLTSPSTIARLLYDYDTPSQASIDYSFIQKDKYGNMLVGSKHTSNNKHKYVHKIINPDSFLTSSVKQNYVYLNGKSIVNFPQLTPFLNNCPDYITLTAANNVTSGTDLRKAEYTITASNVISSGATATYHAGQAVVLTSGFRSVNGSSFRAYIEGCSSGTAIHRINIATDATQEVPSLKDGKLFILSPNPASEMITISATDTIQSIMITSIDGKVIFSRDLHEKVNSFELPVRDYIDGFYAVTVTTINGKVETQKLIKD